MPQQRQVTAPPQQAQPVVRQSAMVPKLDMARLAGMGVRVAPPPSTERGPPSGSGSAIRSSSASSSVAVRAPPGSVPTHAKPALTFLSPRLNYRLSGRPSQAQQIPPQQSQPMPVSQPRQQAAQSQQDFYAQQPARRATVLHLTGKPRVSATLGVAPASAEV